MLGISSELVMYYFCALHFNDYSMRGILYKFNVTAVAVADYAPLLTLTD